jgi:predicted 2-oxoglutarate/Fe(II)-dependent dioxygenase YbiX/peroxiredoxin
MAAGRYVALCFYGEAADPLAQQALALAERQSEALGGRRAAVFAVGTGIEQSQGRLTHFVDSDGSVSRAFGVAPREGAYGLTDLRRSWFVLDPRLRVIATFPLGVDGDAAACRYLAQLPQESTSAQVPVLQIPGVFEPAFCQRLIRLHDTEPGLDSAILTEDGAVRDPGFKRRRDCLVTEKSLVAQVQTRVFRRVVPEIRHVFQFEATRLERMIVACYDAAEQGRFGAHRDNTIAETAHRRFAVSINLNEDFVGGELVFPEYGTRPFKPALGSALVFSCSLMHAVLPVTSGRRYACLPFVYDDAAAELRRRNRASTSVERPAGSVAERPV